MPTNYDGDQQHVDRLDAHFESVLQALKRFEHEISETPNNPVVHRISYHNVSIAIKQLSDFHESLPEDEKQKLGEQFNDYLLNHNHELGGGIINTAIRHINLSTSTNAEAYADEVIDEITPVWNLLNSLFPEILDRDRFIQTIGQTFEQLLEKLSNEDVTYVLLFLKEPLEALIEEQTKVMRGYYLAELGNNPQGWYTTLVRGLIGRNNSTDLSEKFQRNYSLLLDREANEEKEELLKCTLEEVIIQALSFPVKLIQEHIEKGGEASITKRKDSYNERHLSMSTTNSHPEGNVAPGTVATSNALIDKIANELKFYVDEFDNTLVIPEEYQHIAAELVKSLFEEISKRLGYQSTEGLVGAYNNKLISLNVICSEYAALILDKYPTKDDFLQQLEEIAEDLKQGPYKLACTLLEKKLPISEELDDHVKKQINIIAGEIIVNSSDLTLADFPTVFGGLLKFFNYQTSKIEKYHDIGDAILDYKQNESVRNYANETIIEYTIPIDSIFDKIIEANFNEMDLEEETSVAFNNIQAYIKNSEQAGRTDKMKDFISLIMLNESLCTADEQNLTHCMKEFNASYTFNDLQRWMDDIIIEIFTIINADYIAGNKAFKDADEQNLENVIRDEFANFRHDIKEKLAADYGLNDVTPIPYFEEKMEQAIKNQLLAGALQAAVDGSTETDFSEKIKAIDSLSERSDTPDIRGELAKYKQIFAEIEAEIIEYLGEEIFDRLYNKILEERFVSDKAPEHNKDLFNVTRTDTPDAYNVDASYTAAKLLDSLQHQAQKQAAALTM